MTSIFQEMEDNLIFPRNGRLHEFIKKWKTTSVFQEMEDVLIFLKAMEDDINFQGKWKMTYIC